MASSTDSNMTSDRRYYAVMNIQPWSAVDLEVAGGDFRAAMKASDDPLQPVGWLAVFATVTAASAWAQGDPILVVESTKDLP